VSIDGHLSPEQVHARLNHPVIDADGHWLEYGPVISEQIRRVGGDRAVEGFLSVRAGDRVKLFGIPQQDSRLVANGFIQEVPASRDASR